MPQNRDFGAGVLTNFATLLIGLALGFLGGYVYSNRSIVFAQVKPPEPTIEEVTPGIMVGSIGTGLVLAHQIEADGLIVNGFDMLKLQEGVLTYLATRPLVEQADLTNIVNNARAPHLYRVKTVPPTQPPAAPTQPSKQEGQKP